MKRTPENVAAVRAARAAGASYRDIARRHKISEGTARNWCAGAAPAAPPVGTAQPPPPPADVPLPDALDRLAVELDDVEASYAALCRRAASELRCAPRCGDGMPDDSPDPVDDPVGYIGALVRRVERMMRDAEDLGNASVAKQHAATLQKLMPTLRQMQVAESKGEGDVVVTRAEIEAARVKFAERLATLAAQPLTCSECGAALRMRLALAEAGVDTGSKL